MIDDIPWDTLATDDAGACGTLREVVPRCKAQDSGDHEELTGVMTVDPVYVEEWGQPITDLNPQHLDQLADRLNDPDGGPFGR